MNMYVGMRSFCLRSGNQFDFDDAILNALKGLQVDLAINSSLELDDCRLFNSSSSSNPHVLLQTRQVSLSRRKE